MLYPTNLILTLIPDGVSGDSSSSSGSGSGRITLNTFTIARNKIMTGLGIHTTSVSYSKTRLHITLQNQKTSHLIIFNTCPNTF
jgi:hypothetical protein